VQELGGRAGRQPDNGNIPYHGCHAQFVNGSWLGNLGGQEGKNLIFFFLFSENFNYSFELFHEFGLFWELHEFWVLRLLLGDWL